jgi:hypothetical protein
MADSSRPGVDDAHVPFDDPVDGHSAKREEGEPAMIYLIPNLSSQKDL